MEPVDDAARVKPNERARGPLGARGELELVGRDGGRSGTDLVNARRHLVEIVGDVLDVIALGCGPLGEHARRGTGLLERVRRSAPARRGPHRCRSRSPKPVPGRRRPPLECLHLTPRAFDRAADLRRLGLGLGREPTDFVGDDRESPARLAGPRGFDRSVEGKQFRLAGDALDDARQGRDVVQFLASETVEQIGDLDALLPEFTDRVDHAADHGQPPLRLILELFRGGRRVDRRARAMLRAVPERIRPPREFLELPVQVLDLGLDRPDRHRAACRPDREVGDGRAKIVQRARDVAGRSAGFAGPLGENGRGPTTRCCRWAEASGRSESINRLIDVVGVRRRADDGKVPSVARAVPESHGDESDRRITNRSAIDARCRRRWQSA